MSELKEVQWTKDDMVEVNLKEPDDFLKVRETLTRIGVASRKRKTYISPVIFFKEGTVLYCSLQRVICSWMERRQICLRMMFRDATVSSNSCLTGDW